MIPRRMLGPLLYTVLLCTCSGEPSGSSGPSEPSGVKSIVLEATVTTLSALGQKVTITAQGVNAQGEPVPLSQVSWSSTNDSVASVSSAGEVTAHKNGVVKISASAGGVSGEIAITVLQRATRLAMAAAETLFTALGDTVSIVAQAFDSSGAPVSAPVTWSSSQTGIARVSGSGIVTSAGNGSATVTGRIGPVSAVIGFAVQQEPAHVSISGAPGLIRAVGASFDLTAAVRDRNQHPIVSPVVTWDSPDTAVLLISSAGRITTAGVGTATITAHSGPASSTFDVDVMTSRRLPIDPYLATPAAGALWELPVVVIAFIPTADGVNVDVRKAPGFWSLDPMTLDTVEQRVLDFSRRRKMMVEEGSRFHGYKDSAAQPSIGYRVVDYIIVYDIPPAGTHVWPGRAGSPRFFDYFKIFADWGIAATIQQSGVREVWLAESSFDMSFPSYDPAIMDTLDMRVAFESNMSSPTTGDVSNSFRWNDDLPVFGHTYVVYGVSYRRTQAEAVHNVGHQLEAALAYVNWLQDGNTDLFWKQFVGQSALGAFITGRAGWTHMPPNTTSDYDYLNPSPVSSDIEDWRPDGSGARTLVNLNTWASLTYPWPGGPPRDQMAESQWYIYWMQNHPGRGNRIPHGGNWMSNWWAFFGDWDAAISTGLGLYGAQPAATVGSGGYARHVGPPHGTLPVHLE